MQAPATAGTWQSCSAPVASHLKAVVSKLRFWVRKLIRHRLSKWCVHVTWWLQNESTSTKLKWGNWLRKLRDFGQQPSWKIASTSQMRMLLFFHRAWVPAKRSSGGLGVPVFYQILLVTWKLQGMFHCITDFTESLQVFCKLVYIPVGRFSLPIRYK